MTLRWRVLLLSPRSPRPIKTVSLQWGNFYVNAALHYNLSAVPVPHFAEVKQRLATILLPETTAFISVEVLPLVNPRIRFGTLRHQSPALQNEPEH